MRWKVILVALAVVGVSTVPYLIGWAVQTETEVFGGFIMDLDDSNSYLAVMQQGMQGSWRFIPLSRSVASGCIPSTSCWAIWLAGLDCHRW
jgi:hypothetical protein